MEKTDLNRILQNLKIQLNELVHPHQPFLLACSGGKDSMLLANVLQYFHYAFEIVHVNYGWRTEANEDQVWLEHWAVYHQIPIHILKLDGKESLISQFPNDSAQEAARKVRYRFFQEKSSQFGNAWVLTAHHAADQRETLIMRMFEGRTVKPIPQIRPPYYRPLILIEPEELDALRKLLRVSWREDASNFSSDYRRNTFRNQVIPQFNQLNFNWKSGFDLFIQHHLNALEAEEQLLKSLKLQILEENGIWLFPITLMKEHSNRLSALFRMMGIELKEREVLGITKLINASKGKRIMLSKGVVWRERNALLYINNNINTVNLINYNSISKYENLDTWKFGDKLKKPDGSHRKISDWLIDQGFPAFLKAKFKIYKHGEKVIWPEYHSKVEFHLTSTFLEFLK